MGINEKGAVQTSSPFSPATARPASSQTSTFMPRPRHCSSPRYTGRSGFASPEQETMAGPARVVPDFNFHAEAAALQLAAVHRQERIAEPETGDDVGAARDRGELHFGSD